MSNEVTTAKKKVPFSAYMTADVITKKVNSIIGDKKEGAKFISNIVASVQANPMLQECSNQSILSCALVAHSLKVGSKTYNGASDVTITPEDLGLSGAMRFIGSTTTAISEGSTTNPITINEASVTAINGDVVLYNHVEFI